MDQGSFHPFAAASPEQILALLDSMPDGFVTLDADWRITYLNSYALVYTTRLQRTREDLLGHSLWQVFPELSDTPLETAFRQSIKQGHSTGFEFFFPPLQAWFELRTHPSALGLVVFFRDISRRKQDEEKLRQSEEMLRALANSIPQLAWVADEYGKPIWFNQRWYDYSGVRPGDEAHWHHLHDPSFLPDVLRTWSDCLRTGSHFEMEFPMRDRHGEFRWFLTRVNPVRDRHGDVVRWFGTSTDVDQVKRTQEALREESKSLELLNGAGLALAATRELASILETTVNAAAELSGARYGAYFYDEGNTARAVHAAAEGSASFANWCEPLGRSAQLLRVDDLGAEAMGAAQAAYPGHTPVRSLLAAPILARSGRCLGTLVLGHPEPGIFTERAERMVSGIAAQAAVSIDNAHLVQAMQQAADERHLLLEREKAARSEAEHSNRMKDEFLATLSHELRTPLSAILGWAQLLRRNQRRAADWLRGLETIERNARMQAQLVDELLDMSRITAGKVLLDVRPLDTRSVVEAAIETLRPAADAKQIRIESFLNDSASVAGDAERLQQVVWNLLSNAIKFTPRGGLVQVSLALRDGQQEIIVADSGIGIAPVFLPFVFERFRQGDASSTRRHGGLGLGLAIVKHLVELHGGTVTASSNGEHCGACFRLCLPLLQEAAAIARAGPPAVEDRRLRELTGLHVLVVDDEADARELISRILQACGARVRTAASAAEALLLIKHSPPDLLLTDLGMPDMDGYALLAQVRQIAPAEGGTVPALALTAFARPEDRARVLAAGFINHIAKPVEAADLITAIKRGTVQIPT